MTRKVPDVRNGRQIHIRLPEKVHQLLRVRVAESNTTIQDWVAALVEEQLDSSRTAPKKSVKAGH